MVFEGGSGLLAAGEVFESLGEISFLRERRGTAGRVAVQGNTCARSASPAEPCGAFPFCCAAITGVVCERVVRPFAFGAAGPGRRG